jgi:hypothetical protein
MIAIGILLTVLLLAVYVVRRVLRRGGNIHKLAANGCAVVATITETLVQRRSRVEDYYFISYCFRASDGNEYGRKFQVSELDFANFEKDANIDVVYLPAEPTVNALQSTVQQMRDALSASR